MSEIGQVVWFDRKKGFGFVKVVDPQSQLFEKEYLSTTHQFSVKNSFKILFPGETVSLDAEKNPEQGEGPEGIFDFEC